MNKIYFSSSNQISVYKKNKKQMNKLFKLRQKLWNNRFITYQPSIPIQNTKIKSLNQAKNINQKYLKFPIMKKYINSPQSYNLFLKHQTVQQAHTKRYNEISQVLIMKNRLNNAIIARNSCINQMNKIMKIQKLCLKELEQIRFITLYILQNIVRWKAFNSFEKYRYDLEKCLIGFVQDTKFICEGFNLQEGDVFFLGLGELGKMKLNTYIDKIRASQLLILQTLIN